MEKCRVCGKTSIVPERIGNISLCKMCFVKINGPAWKYLKFDKKETVEKQRSLAVEAAKSKGFPEDVITEINNYFDYQEQSMSVCDGCGAEVQKAYLVGKGKLCKKCYSKINTSAWREDDYISNEEIEKNRNKVLNNVSKYGFPKDVIDGINNHFNEMIMEGLIGGMKGREQKLMVFEDRCVLFTNDYFNSEEMGKRYAKLLRKIKPNNNDFLNEGVNIAQSLVTGVISSGSLTEGLKRAGKSYATTSILNAAIDKYSPLTGSVPFKVIKGKTVIRYDYYDIVEFVNSRPIGDDEELGFLRFRSSKLPEDEMNSLLFFFSYDNDMAQRIYSYIHDRINTIKEKTHQAVEKKQSMANFSVADEILKFKNLLDLGVITQEEFDKKKKELLEY